MPITPEQIAVLRSLYTDAFPGPWELARGSRSVNAGSHGKIRCEPGADPRTIHATMALIARVHEALPELLEMAEDHIAMQRQSEARCQDQEASDASA